MNMEIEQKYRIDDTQQFHILTELKNLGTYTLRHTNLVEQQHNVYYDTPDGLLSKQRYSLRLRKLDHGCIATLKGPGEGQGGLFKRDEWEVETTDPHPANWPKSPARTQALALVGNAHLIQLLTIDTRRRYITAVRTSQPYQKVAAINLDDVTLRAGEQHESFLELEIELLPLGTYADLDSLATSLAEHITLQPENRSKLQRGLDLLSKLSRTDTE